MIAQDNEDLCKIPTESPPTGAPNSGGVGQKQEFSTNISMYHRNGAR